MGLPVNLLCMVTHEDKYFNGYFKGLYLKYVPHPVPLLSGSCHQVYFGDRFKLRLNCIHFHQN